MDYYVVLGIAEDADEETVRSAFRALARRYHPDVGAGSSPIEFQRARRSVRDAGGSRTPSSLRLGNFERLVSNRSSLEM